MSPFLQYTSITEIGSFVQLYDNFGQLKQFVTKCHRLGSNRPVLPDSSFPKGGGNLSPPPFHSSRRIVGALLAAPVFGLCPRQRQQTATEGGLLRMPLTLPPFTKGGPGGI